MDQGSTLSGSGIYTQWIRDLHSVDQGSTHNESGIYNISTNIESENKAQVQGDSRIRTNNWCAVNVDFLLTLHFLLI